MRLSFKELLREEKNAAGLFIHSACPALVEIAAYAGFCFVIIDNEHGSWDGEPHTHLIRACDAAGIVPIIRVSKIDETEIKKALDCGAAGVMIPGVSSVEDAKEALKWAKFPPIGQRGACPFVRANQFSAGEKTRYYDRCNAEQAVILLIEGKEGLSAFDEILSIDGVEYVFFGPCDMAVSMGHPGEDGHPEVIEGITRMICKANTMGVYSGVMGFDGKDSRKWLDNGADYVAAAGDVGLFYKICKMTMDEIRA